MRAYVIAIVIAFWLAALAISKPPAPNAHTAPVILVDWVD